MIDPRFTDFTKYLWRGGSFAYWWSPDGDEGNLSSWFPVDKQRSVWNSNTINIYFGVHPSIVKRGMGQRALLETIEAVNCLFAEFDLGEGQLKEHLLQSISQLDTPPSVVVFSGGGYHAYWLLEQTYHIDSPDARQRIMDIQYAWVDFVGSDNAVKDIARVLRVPGSYNRKPQYAPDYPQVQIVKFDMDLIYSLDDFTKQIEPLIEQTKTKRVAVANQDIVPVELDDQTILEKMQQKDSVAAALWSGDMSDYKDDHSDADMALCNRLAFWFGRDKDRIDKVFRRSGLFRPKWLRDDYRNATIDKAVASCANTYQPKVTNLGNPDDMVKTPTVVPVNGNGHTAQTYQFTMPNVQSAAAAQPQGNGQQNSNSKSANNNIFDPWKYIGILAGIGYNFRMNDLDDTIEVNGKPMSDAIEAHINTDMRALGHKEVNVIKDAYVAHASKNPFNPITDYLTSQVWDGQDHIAKLACYFTDKHDLITYPDGSKLTVFHAFLKRWLIGAASKVIGQEQNAMLVLGGPQGIGKSYLATWLCSSLPDFGHEGPIRPDAHQETYMLMTKKFIWEVGELGATTKRQDVEAIKQLIMQKRASYKPPYAHNLINKWVVASFVGTVNDDGTGYLRDTTGNRRFMCVDLVGISKKYSKEINVNQVWAQAVALYKAGETGAPVDCEVESRDAINAEHVMINPAEVYLDKCFNVDPDNEKWVEETEKIIAVLRERGYQGNERQIQMDIAVVLKEKGCRNEKRPSRWYGIKEKSPLYTVP